MDDLGTIDIKTYRFDPQGAIEMLTAATVAAEGDSNDAELDALLTVHDYLGWIIKNCEVVK